MDTLIEFGIACLAALAWGILFRVPRRCIPWAGLAGGIGWLGWMLADACGLQIIGRTVIGALAVGISGEILARRLRQPTTVFLTPGIVPLVPGATSFAAMQAFVVGDYIEGMSLSTEALLAAGAIAAGLALSTSLVRTAYKLKKE